jgi:hypothetical protein
MHRYEDAVFQRALHFQHFVRIPRRGLLQEGYHHGQIKLALKAAGRPFDDEEIGPVTWHVWMRKTPGERHVQLG